MQRIALFLVGMLAGGGLVYFGIARTDPQALVSNDATSVAPAIAGDTPSAIAEQAATSPNTAMSVGELARIESPFEQALGLYRLIEPKSAEELIPLIDEARALTAIDFVPATTVIFRRMAELDPELALEVALSRTELAKPQWLVTIYRAWIRFDPDSAAAVAETLPATYRNMVAPILASAGFVQPSPAGAANIVFGGGSGPIETGDLEAAWQRALDMRSSRHQMSSLFSVATQVAQTDPRRAMELARSVRASHIRTSIEHHVAGLWVTADPDGAVEWLREQTESRARENLVRGVIGQLAGVDFTRAKAAAEALVGDEREIAHLALVGEWSRQDPAEVIEWVQDVENAQTRRQALHQFSSAMLGWREPAEIESWFDNLAEADAEQARQAFYRALAANDPEFAATRVETMADGASKQAMVQNVVSHWSMSDPEAAADWIEAQGASVSAYQALTRGWAHWAPDEARVYAEELRDRDQREHALFGLLDHLSVDEAVAVVRELESPELAKSGARQMLRRVRESGPQAEEMQEIAERD